LFDHGGEFGNAHGINPDLGDVGMLGLIPGIVLEARKTHRAAGARLTAGADQEHPAGARRSRPAPTPGFPEGPESQIQNAPFWPWLAVSSNFHPRNTPGIPAVEIFARLDLDPTETF
jgi:hypothetical protein